jgi:transcription initiation factor IIE alpha subunit
MDWHGEEKAPKKDLPHLNDIRKRLAKLPRITRQFLCRIAQLNGGGSVNPHELEHHLDWTTDEVIEQIRILKDHELGDLEEADEYGDPPRLYLCDPYRGEYEGFEVLCQFASKAGVSLDDLLVDLRFDLLD